MLYYRNYILQLLLYVTISWELFLTTWQFSRQAAFSISFSGSFQWKSESRFATRSTVEGSRFRGIEKEAMNSVIGQQTASPTSSPTWLPLCLSLVPSLDLLLRVSLPFLLSRCLLFPITRHIHAYVCFIREVMLLQGNAWPWTSRRFFGVSRTETGEESCRPRDASLRFLTAASWEKSDRANTKPVIWFWNTRGHSSLNP